MNPFLFDQNLGGANRPGEPSSVGVSGDCGDVVTNDIMFSKVSQSPVFTTAVCALGAFSLLYIIFINSNNNVITSSAPVCKGFVGDIVVTLSRFVPFCFFLFHDAPSRSRPRRYRFPKVEQASRLFIPQRAHSNFQFPISNF